MPSWHAGILINTRVLHIMALKMRAANNNAIRGMRNGECWERVVEERALIDSIRAARFGKDHQLSSHPIIHSSSGIAPSPRLARFMDLHRFETCRATSHGPDAGMWILPHLRALAWSSIVSCTHSAQCLVPVSNLEGQCASCLGRYM